MKIARLLLVSVLSFAFFGFSSASTVHACSCALLTTEDHFNDAKAVFLGNIVSESLTPETEVGENVYTISVNNSSKGDVAGDVTVTTANSSASCGITFDSTLPVLVFAYEGENGLETNLCSGSQNIDVNNPEQTAYLAEVEAIASGEDNDLISTPDEDTGAVSTFEDPRLDNVYNLTLFNTILLIVLTSLVGGLVGGLFIRRKLLVQHDKTPRTM